MNFFLGLLYVIETQKVLDLKVNLMASYVIVPETGFYNGTQNILLLDLGNFKVRKEVVKLVCSLKVVHTLYLVFLKILTLREYCAKIMRYDVDL